MLKNACLIFLAIILMPSFSFGEIKTIYVTHKYVMGDNDSKNDALKMCFLEAKRKVLEKAGTYIESHFEHTVTEKFQMTKDELNVYSAALLKVETIDEKWKLEGNNMAVILTVKADVDSKTFDEQLSKIRQDKSAQKKIKDQQRRLNKLERTVTELQKQLGAADATKAATLRKERNVTFKQIDEIEAKQIAILNLIKAKTKDALKYIEKGMTQSEVLSLIGKPRIKSRGLDYNYGHVWVIFENGLVNCIVYSHCFDSGHYCREYKGNCIAK